MKSFNELPPLKQWVYRNKYHIRTKGCSTHFLLDGGVWNIPLNEYSTFIRLLATDLQNNEKYYLCENKTNVFRFICDLDFYDEDIINIEQVEVLVHKLNNVVEQYFGKFSVIICSTESKTSNDLIKSGFHLVWPKLWINKENAKGLRDLFVKLLIDECGERPDYNTWGDVIDACIYDKNGLRMIGSRKMVPCKCSSETCEICEGTGKKDEGRVYKPVSILGSNNNYIEAMKKDFLLMLMETSIINYLDLPEVPLLKPMNCVKKKPESLKDPVITKIENFIKSKFPKEYSKVNIKKMNKLSDSIILVEPTDNFCMNVNRKHTSSGIYFQIKKVKDTCTICQRCFCSKMTTEGRLSGVCKDYCSKEIELSLQLQKVLFEINKKNKVVTKYNISSSKTPSQLIKNCKKYLQELKNERSK
jgi:hypothetical protein